MEILYVARHGETEQNRQGLLMGQKDVGLNERGIAQAHELGEKVKKLGIDLIITSSMIRARETAQIVNEYIHTSVKLDTRLIERNIGVYDGLTLKEVQEKFQKGYTSEMAYNKTPPKGEGAEKVRKRVFAAMGDLKKNYQDKKVLVVAHSFIIKMINKYFNPNISAEDFFNFTLKNVEVREFKF